MEQLFYALFLPSGNDAAQCIAENIGAILYPETKYNKIFDFKTMEVFECDKLEATVQKCGYIYFIKEMNACAKQLNLSYSFFQNPHGMSEKMNISNISDLIKLSQAACKDEFVLQVSAAKSYKTRVRNDQEGAREMYWKNTNLLLDVDGFHGMKTGMTKKAGGCLVSLFNRTVNQEPFDLLIVVLGCENADKRFSETQCLLDRAINSLLHQRTNS